MENILNNFEPLFGDISTAVRVPADKGFYAKGRKRICDLVLTVSLQPLIAPVVETLWVFVRRDGDPGIFGRSGQIFKCRKARNLAMGGEERLQAYLASSLVAVAEWACYNKLTRDLRITWFGNFLRKSGLDELPQNWNVPKGKMGFVGRVRSCVPNCRDMVPILAPTSARNLG